MFSQLITNADGRLSTTAFIQFFGALLMAGILVFCVWLNRSYVPELFTTFASLSAVVQQRKASPTQCKTAMAKGVTVINLYIVGAAFAVLAGVFIHGRVQAAKIRKQQEEIEFVKREAAAVAQELENANTAKNITETNRTLSGKSVDEQLQSKGYFRED